MIIFVLKTHIKYAKIRELDNTSDDDIANENIIFKILTNSKAKSKNRLNSHTISIDFALQVK